MLQKLLPILVVIATLIFSGCSSKQYYKPETSISLSGSSMQDTLIHYSRDGATLASGNVLTKTEKVNLSLPKGFYFINHSKKAALTADLKGNCHIITNKGILASTKFPQALVAGTLVGKYLIYVLQNNHYGVYDFSQQKIIFDHKSNKAFAIDTRIANPLQIDKLVVIPTLDGKLTILDLSTLKIAKEMYISTESVLNNIIFLNKINNSLIAATPTKVVSVSGKGKKELEAGISEVAMSTKNLFVFTKDGRILKMDEGLTIQAEKKFKFAHFSVAYVDAEKVYALDKQGYLIVSNHSLSKNRVYKLSEVEGYAFISNSQLYFDDEIVDLSKLSYE
ncbi:MAG TPA: hypothetical protein ENK82_09845 [Campylobacterales bacterium]|nr:hypothetical protein [Campylobacterales bacterium]HHS93636.1 hypothetical protein [Campylobacterales bacterium]